MSYFNSSTKCAEKKCKKELSIRFQNRPMVNSPYQVKCPHCQQTQIYTLASIASLIPYTMKDAVSAQAID